MMSKYLIGLIPSFFILLTACLAKAVPSTGIVADYHSSFIPEPAIILLFGLGLIGLANGLKRKKR